MWKRPDESVTCVVNDLIKSYVAWREECGRVEAAYRRWGFTRRTERILAFPAYVAAMDGEDRAAACYRTLVEHVS